MAEIKVEAEIAGTVWKVVAKVGDRVEEDQELIILESMKMELPVNAPQSGTVVSIHVEEGAQVLEGDVVAILNTE